jgi:hypothetical protein
MCMCACICICMCMCMWIYIPKCTKFENMYILTYIHHLSIMAVSISFMHAHLSPHICIISQQWSWAYTSLMHTHYMHHKAEHKPYLCASICIAEQQWQWTWGLFICTRRSKFMHGRAAMTVKHKPYLVPDVYSSYKYIAEWLWACSCENTIIRTYVHSISRVSVSIHFIHGHTCTHACIVHTYMHGLARINPPYSCTLHACVHVFENQVWMFKATIRRGLAPAMFLAQTAR